MLSRSLDQSKAETCGFPGTYPPYNVNLKQSSRTLARPWLKPVT